MKRIAALVAICAGLALTACGGDDESTPASTGADVTTQTQTGSQSTTPLTTSTEATSPAGAPNAPNSATIPSDGAPDNGISTRPGGPSGGGY